MESTKHKTTNTNTNKNTKRNKNKLERIQVIPAKRQKGKLDLAKLESAKP